MFGLNESMPKDTVVTLSSLLSVSGSEEEIENNDMLSSIAQCSLKKYEAPGEIAKLIPFPRVILPEDGSVLVDLTDKLAWPKNAKLSFDVNL